jgi:glutamine amidotransferase
MQLLGVSSEEAPGIQGLSLIDARTKKLPTLARIPHIGWTSVEMTQKNNYFTSLSSERDFYFVHSYHVEVSKPSETLTSTHFGSTTFTSSILSQNIVGFQFHPEKSGKVGQDLIVDIHNWAATSE